MVNLTCIAFFRPYSHTPPPQRGGYGLPVVSSHGHTSHPTVVSSVSSSRPSYQIKGVLGVHPAAAGGVQHFVVTKYSLIIKVIAEVACMFWRLNGWSLVSETQVVSQWNFIYYIVGEEFEINMFVEVSHLPLARTLRSTTNPVPNQPPVSSSSRDETTVWWNDWIPTQTRSGSGRLVGRSPRLGNRTNNGSAPGTCPVNLIRKDAMVLADVMVWGTSIIPVQCWLPFVDWTCWRSSWIQQFWHAGYKSLVVGTGSSGWFRV